MSDSVFLGFLGAVIIAQFAHQLLLSRKVTSLEKDLTFIKSQLEYQINFKKKRA